MVALPRIIVKRWPQAGIDVSLPAECFSALSQALLSLGPAACAWMPNAKALHRSCKSWLRCAEASCPGSRDSACMLLHAHSLLHSKACATAS